MDTAVGWLALGAMGGAVASLLVAERAGHSVLRAVSKTFASLVFVAVAALRFAAGDTYGAWVLVALGFCFAGDLLLLSERLFLPGLVTFLLGHVAYIVAFHSILPASSWSWRWLAPVVAAAALATGWLWPHLGSLRSAVLAYVVVISVMVWGALAVTVEGGADPRIAVGAVLFYLSDLSVARDRFVRRAFLNRAWGLPAYYAGQLLLAFTVGVAAAS